MIYIPIPFNPLRAVVMTYSRAKVQGQWAVGSEDRVGKQTDGGTGGRRRLHSHANAVSKNCLYDRTDVDVTSWSAEWHTSNTALV